MSSITADAMKILVILPDGASSLLKANMVQLIVAFPDEH